MVIFYALCYAAVLRPFRRVSFVTVSCGTIFVLLFQDILQMKSYCTGTASVLMFQEDFTNQRFVMSLLVLVISRLFIEDNRCGIILRNYNPSLGFDASCSLTPPLPVPSPDEKGGGMISIIVRKPPGKNVRRLIWLHFGPNRYFTRRFVFAYSVLE